MISKDRYLDAMNAVLDRERRRDNIGTLGEKTLHAVLKNYFEPDTSKHEIKIGSFFADIASDKGITEIQTRNLYALRRKLDYFLVSYNVTVVHPVVLSKTVCWVDPQSAEVVSSRKSSKKGSLYSALKELSALTDYFDDENLTVCLILCDVEQYNLLDGYGEDKKRRATKFEIIPTALHEEIYIREIRDLMMFIPAKLPDVFTFDQFEKNVKLDRISAHRALKMFLTLGLVRNIGKDGKKYVYEICESID